ADWKKTTHKVGAFPKELVLVEHDQQENHNPNEHFHSGCDSQRREVRAVNGRHKTEWRNRCRQVELNLRRCLEWNRSRIAVSPNSTWKRPPFLVALPSFIQ